MPFLAVHFCFGLKSVVFLSSNLFLQINRVFAYFPGTKHGVVNSANANLIVVLVKTRTPDRNGDLSDSMTIFIVDKSSKGVNVHDKDNIIGCSHLYQSAVSFDNVTVPSAGKFD